MIHDNFFWDGRVLTLEEQSLHPILDTIEMDNDLATVIQRLSADPIYPPMFADAFGDPAITEDRIAKALAQFERTMTWAQAGARDSALWLPMQTFLSILVAPFKHWGTQEVAEGSTEPKTKSGVIVLRILVIAILVVIFASLYIGSNPALQNVLDYFPWQRINGAAFLRVLFYFLLFFGLVHFYVVPAFPKWKAREGNIPTPEKIAEGSDNEWATAKWSFIILSIVLGIINLMDLVFILGGELPDGTSYSGYVHQGFFSLVFSMKISRDNTAGFTPPFAMPPGTFSKKAIRKP